MTIVANNEEQTEANIAALTPKTGKVQHERSVSVTLLLLRHRRGRIDNANIERFCLKERQLHFLTGELIIEPQSGSVI